MVAARGKRLPWLLAAVVALIAAFTFFAIQQASAQNNSPPAITLATIYGNTLTVGYDQDLDESQVPPLSAYVIRINGGRTNVTSVAVSGRQVTLTLAKSAEDSGDDVKLTYRAKATPTLRSASGVNAETVRNHTVGVLTLEVFEPTPTATPESAEHHQGNTPHAPRDVSLSRNDKNDQLVVSWQAPENTNTVTQWQVQCNTDNTNWDAATGVGYSPLASGNLAFAADARYSRTCTSLSTNTRYYARVRAINTAFGPWAATSNSVRTANVVTITANSDSITEGEDAEFTVTLHPAPASNTDVTVVVNAVSGDYGITNGASNTVTVGTGGAGTLTLSTTDDSTDEANGSVTVRVHPAPSGYAKGNPNTASMTIEDNDDATPQPTATPAPQSPTATVAATNASITEGADAAFTVTLNPAPASDVSVTYDITVSGDYGVSAATDRTVTVGTGGTGTITLSTTDDTADETNGSVTVTLVAGTGYSVGTANSATVTVNDNDAGVFVPTNFRVTSVDDDGVRFDWDAPSSGGSVSQYQVRWDEDTDPTDSSDMFTLSPGMRYWDTSRGTGVTTSAQVRAKTSGSPWGGWTHVLYATGNTTANRAKPDKPSVPTVTAGDGELTVTWSAPADYGYSITSYSVRHRQQGTSSWTKQDNAWQISPGGVLSYTISSLTNGTTYEVQVQAHSYNGASAWSVSGAGAPGASSTDPTATVAATNAAITEGHSAVFTVTLSPAPASSVNVTYNITVSGSYGVTAATNQTVSVGAGGTGTISLPTTNDTVDEANGSITVTLVAGTGYGVGTPNSATVTVNDNDDPTATVAADSATITEGSDAVFTVTLSRAQESNVNVRYNITTVGSFGVTAATNRTATVSAGSSTTTITLSTTDDTVDEANGSVTVTLVAGTGYGVGTPNSAAVTVNDNDDPPPATDYDRDGDGLIEIDSLAKLYVIRYDRDGDGAVDDASNPAISGTDAANYAAAFPNPADGMGCPDDRCDGYELAADLDFDTNGNGNADTGDTYWNGGAGWDPIIGDSSSERFAATFEGNGHTIANLFINRSSYNRAGLFSWLDYATVRNLALTGASVTGGSRTGILAGQTHDAATSISYVAVSGSVNASDNYAGGLVGWHGDGDIIASYSTATVTSNDSSSGNGIGGLVGSQEGGDITASYSTGSVSGGSYNMGGLVGYQNTGSITASYSTGSVSGSGSGIGGLVGAQGSGATVTNSYWDTESSGQSASGGGTGKTTAELQAPTGYTGIYANWNLDLDGDSTTDDPWDFGTDHNYPILENVGGAQRRPGPVTSLAATRTASALTVTWAAPTGTTPDGYQYRVSTDGGAMWGAWTDTTGASHAISNPPDATNYAVEVRVDAEAAHDRDGVARIGPPDAPTNLTLTTPAGRIEASWTAPTATGGSAVTDYVVEYRPGTTGNWLTANVTVTGTTATISSLIGGQSYQVRVAAKNVMGAGGYAGPLSGAPGVTDVDYDSDDDGLIEVDSLAKLDAIRYDMDGNGAADDSANSAAYAAAFPSPEAGMGCPTSGGTDPDGCGGYELMADLDFDTNSNDIADSGDAYYNGGDGWRSIGGLENARYETGFNAIFEGNDNTISNLFIDRESTNADTWAAYRVGLFGIATGNSAIRNLTLTGVSVSGEEEVGALVGATLGEVSNVTVTGSVSGDTIDVGGVVGFMVGSNSRILSSSFDGTVSGNADHMGGLVGANMGQIRHSHATGSVTTSSGHASRIGGLAGSNTGTIYASYSVSTVNAPNSLWVGGLVGQNGGPYVRDRGTIVAGYHQGSVSGRDDVGGLVGENYAKILISYSTGAVTKRGQYSVAGGLVGRNELNNNDRNVYYSVTSSYWSNSDYTVSPFGVGSDDRNNNNILDTGETNTVHGYSTSDLQAPTTYTGLYLAWDNYDQDGNAGTAQPWCFGTSSQLPTLKNAAGTCP